MKIFSFFFLKRNPSGTLLIRLKSKCPYSSPSGMNSVFPLINFRLKSWTSLVIAGTLRLSIGVIPA